MLYNSGGNFFCCALPLFANAPCLGGKLLKENFQYFCDICGKRYLYQLYATVQRQLSYNFDSEKSTKLGKKLIP